MGVREPCSKNSIWEVGESALVTATAIHLLLTLISVNYVNQGAWAAAASIPYFLLLFLYP